MEHFERFNVRISGTSSPWEFALSGRVKVSSLSSQWLEVATCIDEHKKLLSARNFHVKESEVTWSITREIFEYVLFSFDCWLLELYENKTCSKISPNTVYSCKAWPCFMYYCLHRTATLIATLHGCTIAHILYFWCSMHHYICCAAVIAHFWLFGLPMFHNWNNCLYAAFATVKQLCYLPSVIYLFHSNCLASVMLPCMPRMQALLLSLSWTPKQCRAVAAGLLPSLVLSGQSSQVPTFHIPLCHELEWLL